MKEIDARAAEELFPSGDQPPSDYARPPQYDRIACDKDVAVQMRDGVNVVVDVYRPNAAGRFPVLLAFCVPSKELQGSDYPRNFPPQPSWSTLWLDHAEAGATERYELLARAKAQERQGDPERWREALSTLPFGRAASPDEIAVAVVFLASPLSAYTTGAILTIGRRDRRAGNCTVKVVQIT